MNDLNTIFEFVDREFLSRNLRVLLVGGHAVNVHGHTRATLDVDFLVVMEDEAQIRALMKEKGYTNQSSHGNVLFCHHPASQLRIDFLKTDSHTMDVLWQSKLERPSGTKPGCPVIGLEHLIAMKLSALRENFSKRRAKDLPDILELARKHSWSFEEKLKPLVDQFGSPELEETLRKEWESF